MTSPEHLAAAVAVAFREEWAKVVAAVLASTGDWDLAEECAQEAFARATQKWSETGVPARPGAWLVTVARHQAIDVLRRRGTEANRLEQIARHPDPDPTAPSGHDDRLPLCSHAAIRCSPPSRRSR